MSGIIWGIINLDKKVVSKKIGISMIHEMKQYKIDNYKYIADNNIFFGCGLQYITPEDINEIIPYYDEEEQLYLTCDAIIDNRSELLKEFGLINNKESDFTDSQYILMAYKKWGKECSKHLLGDYAFVIYDSKRNEVICSKDQLGRRTLYYCYKEEQFAFCTVTNPLLKITGKNTKINERWAADFLALFGGLHVSENEECIYENIKQVPEANMLIVNLNEIKKIKYWNPLDNYKEIKFKDDDECVEAFMKVYKEAVRCRLRCKDDIGIALSGGLDSSSIAAIAAPLLKAEEKVLKSFTSVPINNYQHINNIHLIEDEGESVKLISSYVGNIETHFCKEEKYNAYNVMDELLEIFEQPYKIIENSHFINNIGKEARENNCTVVLKGQYGNVTVSTGDFYSYAMSLINERKFKTLLSQINKACKMHHLPKIKFTKSILQFCIPEQIRRKEFYRKNPKYDRFRTSPINPQLLKKWDIPERFAQYGFNKDIQIVGDFKKLKESMVSPIINSHVTAANTKICLKNGIIFRDPTADVRIIEFCLRVPMEHYVDGGIDRKLIRNAMKGLLPEEIRMNINKRGAQGIDWINRLEPIWGNVSNEINNMLDDDISKVYFDIDKLKKIFAEANTISNDKAAEIRTLLEALIFYKFITKYLFSFNNFNSEGGNVNGKEEMGSSKS